jgi:hypothetical protein
MTDALSMPEYPAAAWSQAVVTALNRMEPAFLASVLKMESRNANLVSADARAASLVARCALLKGAQAPAWQSLQSGEGVDQSAANRIQRLGEAVFDLAREDGVVSRYRRKTLAQTHGDALLGRLWTKGAHLIALGRVALNQVADPSEPDQVVADATIALGRHLQSAAAGPSFLTPEKAGPAQAMAALAAALQDFSTGGDGRKAV